MKNENDVHSITSLNKNESNEISSQCFGKTFPLASQVLQRVNSTNVFNKKSDFNSNLKNTNNHKSNSTIKSILDKMVSIKKTNMRLSNDITKDICSSIRKEKLIFSVRQEASYIEKQNDYLKGTCEKVDKMKDKCETNRKAVTEYHKSLLEQYENCMQTVAFFESTMKEMKNEEIFLEKSQQTKIHKLSKSIVNKDLEKAVIETQINEVLKMSQKQQKEIHDLEKEIEESLKLKEKERKQIEVNKKKEDQIIRNLEKNLEGLEKKIGSFVIKEENKGEDLVSEEEFKQGQNNIPQIKEDLDIKLNECKQQNNVLLEQIRELTSIINAAKKKALFEEAERKRIQEEIQLEESKMGVNGKRRVGGLKKGRDLKGSSEKNGLNRSKSSVTLQPRNLEVANVSGREKRRESIKFDSSVKNIVKK